MGMDWITDYALAENGSNAFLLPLLCLRLETEDRRPSQQGGPHLPQDVGAGATRSLYAEDVLRPATTTAAAGRRLTQHVHEPPATSVLCSCDGASVLTAGAFTTRVTCPTISC